MTGTDAGLLRVGSLSADMPASDVPTLRNAEALVLPTAAPGVRFQGSGGI